MLATTTSMRGSAAAAGRSSLSTATTRSVCVGFVHRPLHANGGLLPCSIGSSIGLAYHRHEAAPASHVASAGKGGFGAQRDKLPPSETCPCCLGKKVYKECCAPFHTGNATPETPEQALRARFSAYVKDEEAYLINTFSPLYLKFKYPDATSPDDAAAQLKRDIRMACTSYSFRGLKVLKTEQPSDEEAFIEFSYESTRKSAEKRGGSRMQRSKAAPVETNLDGSTKVGKTVERSRFVKQGSAWQFASYELKTYPEWMQEAKDAELKSAQKAA